MCGIVGIINGEKAYNVNVRNFFTQALYTDTLRGRHSTGVHAYPLDPRSSFEHMLFKKAIPGHDFTELKLYEKFAYNIEKYKYVIGHNRAATRGAVNSINAHPFQHGKVTLVHNGSLDTHAALTKENYDVDSEAICAAFSQRDPRDVIPTLRGAFALVWTDQDTGLLHMVRNEERPLAFVKIKNKDQILFASEKRMLQWLAERNKLEIEKTYTLNPGRLLTFGKDDKKVTEWDTEEVELYKPTYWYGTGHGYPNYNSSYKGGTPASKKSGSADGGKSGNVVALTDNSKKGSKSKEAHQKDVAEKVNEILSPYGYKHGDSVEVYIDEVIQCSHDKVHARGYTIDPGEQLDVVMFSAAASQVKQGEMYICTIHATTGDVNSDLPTLVLDRTDFVLAYTPNQEDGKEVSGNSEPLFRGPEGVRITGKEFLAFTADGCNSCGKTITLDDAAGIDWTIQRKPVCATCLATPHHLH